MADSRRQLESVALKMRNLAANLLAECRKPLAISANEREAMLRGFRHAADSLIQQALDLGGFDAEARACAGDIGGSFVNFAYHYLPKTGEKIATKFCDDGLGYVYADYLSAIADRAIPKAFELDNQLPLESPHNNAAKAVETLRNALIMIDCWAADIISAYEDLASNLKWRKPPNDDDWQFAFNEERPTECGELIVDLDNEGNPQGYDGSRVPVFNAWSGRLWDARKALWGWFDACDGVDAALVGLPVDLVDDSSKPVKDRWSTQLRRQLNSICDWLGETKHGRRLGLPVESLRFFLGIVERDAMPKDWRERLQALQPFDVDLRVIWQRLNDEAKRTAHDRDQPTAATESGGNSATGQVATREAPSGGITAGKAFVQMLENDPEKRAGLERARAKLLAFAKVMREMNDSPEYRAAQEADRQRWQELANVIRENIQWAGDELAARHFARPVTLEDWMHLARVVEISPNQIDNLTPREIFACAMAWADRQTIKAKLAAGASGDRSVQSQSAKLNSPQGSEGNDNGTRVVTYVTLGQMAAIVSKSKRTLEDYKKQLPSPDVKGGKGRADEWQWDVVRPFLEKLFARKLPIHFPGDKFVR